MTSSALLDPLRSIAGILTLTSLVASASAHALAAPSSDDMGNLVALEQVLGGGHEHLEATRLLEQLGPQATQTFMGVLAGTLRLAGDEHGPLVTHASEELLFEAMGSWPAEPTITAAVDWLGPDSNSRERLLVLRLMGEVGRRDVLHSFFDVLAGIPPEQQRHPSVGRQVERALAGILQRDARGHQVVSSKLRELDSDALASVARAAGLASTPGGIALLEQLMDRNLDLDLVVLTALGDWKQPKADCSDRAAARLALEALASSEEKIRQRAAMALGKLHDSASIPALVALLDDPNARVRRAAHWALEGTARELLPAEPEPWNRWLSEEEAWLESSRDELDALLGSDSGLAVAALRSLAMHPMYGSQFSTEIAGALRHADVDVARAACGTLAHLRTRCALAPLVEALGDPRAVIRLAAADTLEGLTAAGLGADIEAWRDWLLR